MHSDSSIYDMNESKQKLEWLKNKGSMIVVIEMKRLQTI